ncbi:DUF1643 domain-containing protein [Microbacterium invictum]|uniref:DUF1643 domain-containing protein n=1 Tax=Microbacterium invictum TaxID=515415 RepID=A0AA40SQ84_9MICO|nr:DUF1643 domain-containing protein [Microbacterium invictum]MBB4140405.1 hypothetical protein [Microbacterium invictum]
MSIDPDFISATADIQGDYRYSLTRVWNDSVPQVTYVLLNPSTADGYELDNTLKRCVSFAKGFGFGGMKILNLYAFRTKSPKIMLAAKDPVGPETDRELAAATGTVIAGWGTNAEPARVLHALTLLPQLHALAITKDGHPGHPLYVHSSAQLVEWP